MGVLKKSAKIAVTNVGMWGNVVSIVSFIIFGAIVIVDK